LPTSLVERIEELSSQLTIDRARARSAGWLQIDLGGAVGW